MTNSVKVVGIPGSLREGSHTRAAVMLALEGAAEAGATTRLLELQDYELVFAVGGLAKDRYPPDVFRLREDVREAQGIILGTPEYHGSLSGVLKNALDLMGFHEFEGKMVGLIGVAGGAMGAAGALESLRAIGRALHAWVIPHQVSIPQAWKRFDANGTLTDADLAQRLRELGRQVARFAALHDAGRDPEFLEAWQSAPENPGGA